MADKRMGIKASWKIPEFPFPHWSHLVVVYMRLPCYCRMVILKTCHPKWQNHSWLFEMTVHASAFRSKHLHKNTRKAIWKQPEPDGSSDEWGREREVEEWVVSHSDVFSLKLFEHCNQNLLWHQPYNSIYPPLFPFSISLSLSHLSSVMLNEQQLEITLLSSSVWVCVRMCWVRSSAGGLHL